MGLALLALLALLAPRAGYRRFTILLLLIPVYGAVVAARIMWRWTDIGGWDRRHSSTSPGPSAEALVPARL